MEPKELRFTKTHEWIAKDGTVGLSDHAQHEITDVVFVELPAKGRLVKSAEACCVVESVKAAFDIYAPADGEVCLVNDAVAKNPALVNQSPYGDGWLFKLQMANATSVDTLMTLDQYQEFLKSGAH